MYVSELCSLFKNIRNAVVNLFKLTTALQSLFALWSEI